MKKGTNPNEKLVSDSINSLLLVLLSYVEHDKECTSDSVTTDSCDCGLGNLLHTISELSGLSLRTDIK